MNSSELNAMMETYPDKFRLGNDPVTGRSVFMSRPSFDCEWYWGFGYLGNLDCHFHLSSLHTMYNSVPENMHLFDQMKKFFGDSLTIKDDRDLWTFVEVVLTIYTLRKTADLFYMGGSGATYNPLQFTLKDAGSDMYKTINESLIPQQIAAMYAVLAKYTK